MYKRQQVNALFELLTEAFVYLHAQIVDRVLVMRQHDRRIVVGQLTFWFCVAAMSAGNKRLTLAQNARAYEMQIIPALLQQVVEIPFVMRRNRYTVRYFVDDVQLLCIVKTFTCHKQLSFTSIVI